MKFKDKSLFLIQNPGHREQDKFLVKPQTLVYTIS